LLLVGVLSAIEPPNDETLLRHAALVFGQAVRESDPHVAREAYRSASRDFEALLQRGHVSPALYHNLGNARLLAGELPEAIIAYRRGVRFAPADPDLAIDLQLARAQVNRPGGARFWRGWLSAVEAWLENPWSWVVIALLHGGAWMCWAIGRRFQFRWIGRLSIALFGLVLLCAALWIWSDCRARRLYDPCAVVNRGGVFLRKGNGLAYDQRLPAPLRPGLETRCLFEREGWLQVEMPTGEIGWVPTHAVLRDFPNSSYSQMESMGGQ
jgi:hypothetical protein